MKSRMSKFNVLIRVGLIVSLFAIVLGFTLAQGQSPDHARSNIVYVQGLGQNMPDLMGTLPASAVTVRTPAEAESYKNIDGLIVHASAMGELNREWAQNLYKNGKTVSFVNVSSTQAGEMLGDSCLFDLNLDATPDTFIIATLNVTGEKADEVNRVRAAHMRSCNKEALDDITAPVNISYRYTGTDQPVESGVSQLMQDHIDGK